MLKNAPGTWRIGVAVGWKADIVAAVPDDIVARYQSDMLAASINATEPWAAMLQVDLGGSSSSVGEALFCVLARLAIASEPGAEDCNARKGWIVKLERESSAIKRAELHLVLSISGASDEAPSWRLVTANCGEAVNNFLSRGLCHSRRELSRPPTHRSGLSRFG